MNNDTRRRRMFCFGLGYSARRLVRDLMADGWSVAGTCRNEASQTKLVDDGIDAFVFDGENAMVDAAARLSDATHILVSAPPDANGDPVLRLHEADIVDHAGVNWIGYLSTTGVYGDAAGGVVDESSPRNPTSERSRQRAAAEDGWLRLFADRGLPVHVFRLAGIYGPGRSALDQVRAGRARRIDRPRHLFSRIHVDDIAAILKASIARPDPGAAYNVCDDMPAAAAEVTTFACELVGVDPPPLVAFEEAASDMSPMALSFWRDNRRVDNGRIKRDLGVRLIHRDYQSGLRAILAAGG